jgi:DNA-binding transcriptional ArsR family regulator
MTGKAQTAHDKRLSICDDWVRQPDNIARLREAAAGKVTMPAIGSVLRLLVLATSAASGCAQQSIDQIAAVTLMSPDMVRRALKALETAGAVVTVYKGRKGINGTGRPAGRRVLFLAGDNSAEMAISVQSGGYQRAVDGLSACSQLHDTSVVITSEYITSAEFNSADTEPEQGKGKPAQTDMRWSDEVVSQVVSNLALRVKNQRNPAAVRMDFKIKAQTAAVQVLDQYGTGVTRIRPTDYDWSSLVMVTASLVQGEPVSRATSDALQTAANNALTS